MSLLGQRAPIDGVDAPPNGIDVPEWRGRQPQRRERSRLEVSIIGLDLAKTVFQVHGASESGATLVRKKLRRDQMLPFFSSLPRCVVAMEACASAHYWDVRSVSWAMR